MNAAATASNMISTEPPAPLPGGCRAPGAGGTTPTERSRFWIPLSVDDADTIRRRCPAHTASVLIVWIVLLREACFRRTRTFQLAYSFVADRAGLSRRTAMRAAAMLAEIGMLTTEAVKATPTSYAPVRWTLRPSAWLAGDGGDTRSSDGGGTRGGDMEEAVSCHRLLDTREACNLRDKTDTRRRRPGLTPSAAPGVSEKHPELAGRLWGAS